MDYKKHISASPEIMLGKPVITGTRITVELIIRKLSEGANISDILSMYSHLTEANVYAALSYAAEVLSNEEVIELQK